MKRLPLLGGGHSHVEVIHRLGANPLRALTGQPLVTYLPQKITLALISAGDRYAVASWGNVAFEGKWVWR